MYVLIVEKIIKGKFIEQYRIPCPEGWEYENVIDHAETIKKSLKEKYVIHIVKTTYETVGYFA